MLRQAAAVVVVLCLSPAVLEAQSTELVVNTASAAVHKTPSTGSPVVGTARRGAVLEVTREVGDWVKVSWPESQDGFGYVHVSMGTLANRSTSNTTTPPVAASGASSAPAPIPMQTDGTAGQRSAPAVYIAPPTHFVGFGGLVASPAIGVGATARVWSRNSLGVQFEMSRYSLTSDAGPDRMTSMQFGSSLLYSMRDRVTDYVWVRPYAGAGGSIYRSKLSSTVPGDSPSQNRFAVRAFGGAEMTFASMPRFAVSADLGYRWAEDPFPGFQIDGFGISVSGHWYVK